MKRLQATKVVQLTGPVSATDPTENYADTAGFDEALIILNLGAVGGSGISAAKMQECDTSGGSYTDISGANFAGGTDIEGNTSVVPAAANDDEVWLFDINLLATKRYIKLILDSATNASLVSAVAVLGRAEIGPANTNADRCTSNVGGTGVVIQA